MIRLHTNIIWNLHKISILKSKMILTIPVKGC